MLEQPFSSSPSLPAVLPVIYMSVTDTRIGPCTSKHRLPASCCSHSLSLLELEDFQNSLADFYNFSFSLTVCCLHSVILVRGTLSKRGAVSLSHLNALQLLDQSRVIDFAFKFSCSIRAPQSLGFKQRIMFFNPKLKKHHFPPPVASPRNRHPQEAALAECCPNMPSMS